MVWKGEILISGAVFTSDINETSDGRQSVLWKYYWHNFLWSCCILENCCKRERATRRSKEIACWKNGFSLHMRNIVFSFSELRKLSSPFSRNLIFFCCGRSLCIAVLIHRTWLSDLTILWEVSFSNQDKLHCCLPGEIVSFAAVIRVVKAAKETTGKTAWQNWFMRSKFLGNSTCSIYRL